jgi:hypothetical protein
MGMNDRKQLAAMGEHMAEQPLCMAKRIEELEAQVCGLVGLLREAMPYVKDCADWGREHDCDLRDLIDATLSGKLPEPVQAKAPLLAALEEQAAMLERLENSHGGRQGLIAAIDSEGNALVPEGWQMVPVVPTREMCEAFHEAHEEWESGDNWRLDSPDHQWAAMLAAAPKPDTTK